VIEEPECELGYPEKQLERILGNRLPAFNTWMAGQTIAGCEGRKYNYARKEFEPTGCGPHGFVVYASDVERFLAGLPVID
jgi:hypothetical protein